MRCPSRELIREDYSGVKPVSRSCSPGDVNLSATRRLNKAGRVGSGWSSAVMNNVEIEGQLSIRQSLETARIGLSVTPFPNLAVGAHTEDDELLAKTRPMSDASCTGSAWARYFSPFLGLQIYG